ncbi:MAG: hypothetical protein IIY07_08320 [Thermoguttaceae bacterium]|nr:hypothetical protein [Thermoguttaceae bacterium]
MSNPNAVAADSCVAATAESTVSYDEEVSTVERRASASRSAVEPKRSSETDGKQCEQQTITAN